MVVKSKLNFLQHICYLSTRILEFKNDLNGVSIDIVSIKMLLLLNF